MLLAVSAPVGATSAAPTPEHGAVASEPNPDAGPQDQEPRESVTLTTSLVTPFFGAYEVAANLRLTDHWGLLVNASTLVLDNDDWHTNTRTVGAGVTYSWSGTSLRGWYSNVVGEAMFSSWSHEPSGQKAPLVFGYTAIAITGYRFIWDLGPVVDVGLGAVALRFPSASISVDGETLRSKALTKVYPAVKVSVGWAF
jgi:hypothetical protein